MTPSPTLLHRLFRIAPGGFPRWLLSRSRRGLDVVTIAVQLLLLAPPVAIIVWKWGNLFNLSSLLFGSACLAAALLIDVAVDAFFVEPARRTERIAVRELRRRIRHVSPARRCMPVIKR